VPTDVLSASDVAHVLTRSAQELRGAASELDSLDAAVGDGDHGSSVATLFETAVAKTNLEEQSAGHLLNEFGQSLLRHCSGASGTLYAVLFTNLGSTLEPDDAIGLSALARGFRRGLDMVQKAGGATPGDATMVDALDPFVDVLEEQARDNATLSVALERAADAAKTGAVSTSQMVARVGRARGFGDRTRGHEDPGARSFAVIANAWRTSS